MSKAWPMVRLGEVLQVVTRPVSVQADRMYRQIGIRSHGKGVFHKEAVPGIDLGNKKVFWMEPGDFVINIVFGWEGAIALLGQAEEGMIGSHRFPTFRAEEDRLDSRFLLYYCKTHAGLDLLGRVSPGGAGRNRTLSKTAFLQQRIPLPPIAEQRRIISRIEELAGLIEESQRLRVSVDHEINAMLAAEHRKIAEQAPRRPLGEIAPLNRRPVTVALDESYPLIAVRSFGRGTFHKPPLHGNDMTWEKPFLVKSGDILVSNIKAWEGALAVAKTEDDGRFGSHRYLTFVPRTGIATGRFVTFYLLTPEGLHMVGEASPGSADRNRTLRAQEFMKIPIPVPDYASQLRFDFLCEEVDSLKRLQSATAAELDALLPAILDRAFKGEL